MPAPLPFPFDPDALAPGLAPAFSAAELGAMVRLSRAAWAAHRPGEIPDDDGLLASIAQMRAEEWQAARPRLLLVFAPGAPGRLFSQAVADLHAQALGRAAEEAARAEANHRRTRAATAASVASRQRGADVTPTSRGRHADVTSDRAPALRIPESALPLKRSGDQSADPSARALDSVCADLSAGAGALEEAALRGWRFERALSMLQAAVDRWRKAGRTSFPVARVRGWAEGPHSTPARVEYLVQEADAQLLASAGTARGFNPVAYLIAGLGLRRDGDRTPAEVPMFVAERWRKVEDGRRSALTAARAIEAHARRAVDQARKNPAARNAGGEGA